MKDKVKEYLIKGMAITATSAAILSFFQSCKDKKYRNVNDTTVSITERLPIDSTLAETTNGIIDGSGDTIVTDNGVIDDTISVETTSGIETTLEETTMPETTTPEITTEEVTTIPETIAPDNLNLTEDSNTRNDKFESGKITINGSEFELSEELENSLYNAINKIQNKGISLGFYLTDVETNMTISYNATKNFQPASTVKAGAALYAVKQIELGKYSFDDLMTYGERHYCGGSGTIQKSKYGTQFTLKEIIHRTINVSDNIGYYMILDKIGYKNYNNMVAELGVNNFLPSRKGWGKLTPQELNLIWQEIYAYSQSSEYGQWLFNEFLNAQYNFVYSCLPEYKSAHKSGFNQSGYHDSAVVFGDRTYIVTYMSTQTKWDYKNMDTVVELLDDAVKEYNKYIVKNSLTEHEANPDFSEEINGMGE